MKKQKNKLKFDAVIWDFDGTIADTQKIHAKTEVDTLKKYGIKISEREITKRFAGVKLSVIFKTLFEENNIGGDYKEAREIKWRAMHKLMIQKTPKFMPGVKKLLKKLQKQNIKMAIASSSIKSYLDLVVDKMKIRNLFQVIITGDDVRRGKPDPKIFIKTAKYLKVKPKQCLVIEDGTAGVIAAQKAKMKCIAVGDHIDKSVLNKKSIYINTLEKIDLNFINKLF